MKAFMRDGSRLSEFLSRNASTGPAKEPVLLHNLYRPVIVSGAVRVTIPNDAWIVTICVTWLR